MNWLLMLASMPASSGSARVRLWRAARTLGCGAFADGSYLLPGSEAAARALDELAAQVRAEGGHAWVVGVVSRSSADEAAMRRLFDRASDWNGLVARLAEARRELPRQSRVELARTLRRLARAVDALAAIDYFPNEASAEARAAWEDFRAAAEATLSPGEPHPASGTVALRDPREYRGRRWATRRDLWVDRVASAWLIRRFVDPKARFAWLASPEDCPADALGFDFDGAAFTHVGHRVTFEVLAASFGLEADPGVARLGALVHALDAGGAAPPEARGFEAVLSGARQRLGGDDDALLEQMSQVLDSLHAHFREEAGA